MLKIWSDECFGEDLVEDEREEEMKVRDVVYMQILKSTGPDDLSVEPVVNAGILQIGNVIAFQIRRIPAQSLIMSLCRSPMRTFQEMKVTSPNREHDHDKSKTQIKSTKRSIR